MNSYETKFWEFSKSLNTNKVIVSTKRKYSEVKNDCKFGYLEFYFDDFNNENYSSSIKSILDRKYITDEEREDLLCNVDKIQQMLILDTRNAKVSFNKSGGTAKGSAITNRVTIPTSWIKELGITEDDRLVRLTLQDCKITIEKVESCDI